MPDDENDLLEFNNIAFSDFIESIDERKDVSSMRTTTESSFCVAKNSSPVKAPATTGSNSSVVQDRKNKNEDSSLIQNKTSGRGTSSNAGNERKSAVNNARSPFSHEKPPASSRGMLSRVSVIEKSGMSEV